MDWKLELVIVPVSDIDRAKAFYTEQLGFALDVDHAAGDFRVVQMTPPGSSASISIGTINNGMAPGSVQGLHLCVNDIEAAQKHLADNGVEAGDIFHMGPEGQGAGPDPQRADFNSFLPFSDPDGNGWLIQEKGHASA